MSRRANPPTPSSAAWSRKITTLVWTLLAISLFAAGIFARPAPATPADDPVQAFAASPLEDEEAESEEISEDWEEEDEWEEDEEEGAPGPLLLPPECKLHSAEAQASVSSGHNSVRLTIHYTSYTPGDVTVVYWLKGDKGSLQLGKAKRHFARQGALRENTHLSDRAMEKARAARAFIVQLDISAAPPSCDRYASQRLTVKRLVGGQATWSRLN